MMDEKKRKELTKEFEGLKWPEIADRIAELKIEKAEAKAAESEATAKLEFICRDLIPDRMAEQGLRGIPLEDGSRIELRQKAFCSVLAQNRPAFHAWLEKQGHGSLITETVNPSTLKAFIKEQKAAEDGDVPPDDLVSYTPFVEATLVGRKAT